MMSLQVLISADQVTLKKMSKVFQVILKKGLICAHYFYKKKQNDIIEHGIEIVLLRRKIIYFTKNNILQ